jgi:hypothetical protein
MKRNGNYHILRGATIQDHGPGIPLHLPVEAPPLRDTLCRMRETYFPVTLSCHLSAQTSGPGRYTRLRPCFGMDAEATENLTLSRAHVCCDSSRSSAHNPSHPEGSEWLVFVCLTGCSLVAGHRMQYAMCVRFLDHSLTNCLLIRCTALPPRGMRKSKDGNLEIVKLIVRAKCTYALINCYNKNYTTVNEYLQ